MSSRDIPENEYKPPYVPDKELNGDAKKYAQPRVGSQVELDGVSMASVKVPDRPLVPLNVYRRLPRASEEKQIAITKAKITGANRNDRMGKPPHFLRVKFRMS
jgi:hypothetical protein